jgi:hypothetical protein
MPAETRVAILECAGNSRVFPRTLGSRSSVGTRRVGSAEWTRVPVLLAQ